MTRSSSDSPVGSLDPRSRPAGPPGNPLARETTGDGPASPWPHWRPPRAGVLDEAAGSRGVLRLRPDLLRPAPRPPGDAVSARRLECARRHPRRRDADLRRAGRTDPSTGRRSGGRCRERAQPGLDRPPLPPRCRERRHPAGVRGAGSRKAALLAFEHAHAPRTTVWTRPGVSTRPPQRIRQTDHGSSAAMSAWISDCSSARA